MLLLELDDELLELLDDELLELLDDELLLELLGGGCGGSHAEAGAENVADPASISHTTSLTPLPAIGFTFCGPKTWLPELDCCMSQTVPPGEVLLKGFTSTTAGSAAASYHLAQIKLGLADATKMTEYCPVVEL